MKNATRSVLFAISLFTLLIVVPEQHFAAPAQFGFIDDNVFITKTGDQSFSGLLDPKSFKEYSGTFKDDQKANFEAKFRPDYAGEKQCPTFELQLFDSQRNLLTTSASYERNKVCVAAAGVEIHYSQNYRILYAHVVNNQTTRPVKFELKIIAGVPDTDTP